MLRTKLEYEADSDHSTVSKSFSETTESSSSFYQNYEINHKGAPETRRKVKKLRSIKLVRLPSVRFAARQSKIQSDYLPILSSDAESSSQPNQVEMSDASPNYMKTTTSSSAKKDNLQKSARTLTRRSSFKPPKNLTRLPSTKFRRTLMRKSSGGSDLKKKMKKSRSIKLRNRSSIVSSHHTDKSPNHSTAIGSSDADKSHFEASSCDCESSSNNNDASKRSNPKLNLASGNKSTRVITRTSSLKPLRMLSKMASLRTKRSSIKKSSQILDTDIHRPTCSSALKDSKFPNHLELQPGGSESEGISTMKVCPYSYCSLHGHRHSTVPPLKRFVSMRRRVLKTQRSIKLENQSSHWPKGSSKTKRRIWASEMTSDSDAAVLESTHNSRVLTSTPNIAGPKADLNSEGTHAEDGEGTGNSGSAAEAMLCELSTSLNLKHNPQLAEFPTAERHVEECFEGKEPNSLEYVLDADPEHNGCKGDSELNTFEENTSGRLGSRTIDNKVSESTSSEENTASEEKNGDFTRDNQLSMPDFESDCNTDVEDKTKKEKQKHVGLWHLVYQHMASGIAADDEVQAPVTEINKEEEENAKTSLENTDHGWAPDDRERGSHFIQLYQSSAIKLVQEAFDKILSEIPDHSPDDESSDSISGRTSGKELADKNHGEGGELSFSTSFNLEKEGMLQGSEQHVLKADGVNEPEVDKAQSEMGSKSTQQTPKSWSNLKKIIVLKRFVRALAKVRKFNPRKPQTLPVQIDSEAEKIHLRHQTVEERKHSEEWMLDYALRKVISALAPAQKRKVGLLVQAFETVIPLPDIGTSPRSNLDASSQATPAQSSTGASYQKDAGEGKETNIFGVSLRKTSFPDMKLNEDQNRINDSQAAEEQASDSCPKLKEPSLESSRIHTALSSQTNTARLKENFEVCNPDNGNHNPVAKDDQPNSTNCCLVEMGEPNLRAKPLPKLNDIACTSTEVLVNRLVLQEASSSIGSEDRDHDLEFNSQQLASNGQINAGGEQSDAPKIQIMKTSEESIENRDVSSSASVSELVEESPKVTKGETILGNKFLQLITPDEKSKSHSTDLANERQKNMGLWYLIYKHMVSGNTTLLYEEEDSTGQGDDAKTPHEMYIACSHRGSSVASLGIDVEHDDAGSCKVDLKHIEAIRMVEEAIDEIPLPDTQDDSPEDHCITSYIIPDQKYLEKQPGGESDSTKVEQSHSLDLKEPYVNSKDTAAIDREGTEFREENKPKLQTQKSWSNLKKLILLRRFVKALEKVKKINPREPQFLPLNHEKEAEKVLLRHQNMEDKKNADEWMLDYALQQVVTKLTPARKRKVQLLVEAFETVIPTTES